MVIMLVREWFTLTCFMGNGVVFRMDSIPPHVFFFSEILSFRTRCSKNIWLLSALLRVYSEENVSKNSVNQAVKISNNKNKTLKFHHSLHAA